MKVKPQPHGNAFIGALYKPKKTNFLRARLFLSPTFLLVEGEAGIVKRLTSSRVAKG